MVAEIDLKSNECGFPECRHYEQGTCNSKEHRKECIDIALSVLCIDEVIDERDDG